MSASERGRSPRGSARREELVRAAGVLLSQRGVGAVSHRAVARQAGVPLAATTYYFTSLEALLGETVQALAAAWLGRARAALDLLPAQLTGATGLAEAAVAVAVPSDPDRDDLSAMYDRYLEAGRSPALRPVVEAYDTALDDLLAQVLPRAGQPGDRARLLLAVIDGAVLRALAEGRPPRAAAVSAVETLVGVTVRSQPERLGVRRTQAPAAPGRPAQDGRGPVPSR
jgi:DNA-binding transcriptional regulator YbjK